MVIPDPNCRRVFRLLRRPWSGVIALQSAPHIMHGTVRYTFYTFSKSRFLFLNRTGLSGRPLPGIIYSLYKRSYFSPFNCSSPKLSPPLFPPRNDVSRPNGYHSGFDGPSSAPGTTERHSLVHRASTFLFFCDMPQSVCDQTLADAVPALGFVVFFFLERIQIGSVGKGEVVDISGWRNMLERQSLLAWCYSSSPTALYTLAYQCP